VEPEEEEEEVVSDGEGAAEGEDPEGDEEADDGFADEGPQLGGDLMDISNSYAIKHLEKLVTTGQLTETRAERLKGKYEKLYQMVLKIFESERMLLQKARQLHKEVLGDKKKFARFQESQKEEKSELEKLRAELSKADADKQIVEEQVMIKNLEQAELKRQLKEADEDRRRLEQERMEQLEPKLRALNAEIESLEDGIKLCDRQQQNTSEERIKTNRRIDDMSKLVEQSEKDRHRVRTVLEKTKNDPDKLARQAGVVESAVNGLKADLDEQSGALEQLKADVKAHDTKRSELEEELATLKSKYHKFQSVVETKALALQEIETEIEYQHEKDNRTRDKLKELDNKMSELNIRRKERDDELSDNKKHEIALQRKEVVLSSKLHAIQNLIQPYKLQQDDMNFESKDGDAQKKKLEFELDEMRKDVDILIHHFLIAEKMSQTEGQKVQQLELDKRELEQQVKDIRQEYKELKDETARVTAERELQSRNCSNALASMKASVDELRMRDSYIADLKRQQKMTQQKRKEFDAKYDVVKNLRNKYVEQIQETTQQLAELRDKIKILENEVEILENDNDSKEVRHQKQRKEFDKATVERDHMSRELNELNYEKKKKMLEITNNVAEIAKLNHVIDRSEKEMVSMKTKYEMTMEERNFMGIQLIDRNDELCILYEKANIQDTILHKGQVDLRKREQEIRMLKITLADQARHKEVMLKKRDTVPGFEGEVKVLQQELKSEREECDRLSKALVTPNNTQRWRWVRQEPPDPDELRDKIHLLEERLNDKQEQLLEKELVLEEVSNLSERLRKQANDGRGDTLELAKKVNEYQAKIRAKTRKMMACVSELSMYQASAMKLAQEKEEMSELLASANDRLGAGEVPIDGLEEEWARIQFREMKLDQERQMREQDAKQPATAGGFSSSTVHVTRTTAEPRPNAYIPDEIGIPKPYGACAPFKPQEAGASMRHIKKPVPQEIQI